MGKKYIIELLDECNSEFKGIMVFGLAQEKQISVELIPEESLRPYTEPEPHAEVTADAYQRGYEAGLNDEKEGKATCQYCEYEYLDETEEPCKKCCKAYMNKYKPKVKEEQIRVGDEVNAPFGKAIVVNIDSVAEKIWLVYADGHGGFEYFKDAPTKTGRHFPEIAEVLEKMRGEQDGKSK